MSFAKKAGVKTGEMFKSKSVFIVMASPSALGATDVEGNKTQQEIKVNKVKNQED